MKAIIWIGFAVLALLWTGGAVAVSAALQWAVGLVTSGEAAALGQSVAAWPVPAWTAYWFDPGAVRAALEGVVWTLDALQQARPWVGSALGWLVPLTWGIWALGMLTLVGLAAGAHLLVRRLALRRPALAAARAEPAASAVSA